MNTIDHPIARYPKKWRIICGTLRAVGAAFSLAFLFAILFWDFDVPIWSTTILMLFICCTMLIDEAVVSGDLSLAHNPNSKRNQGYLALGMIIFCFAVFVPIMFYTDLENDAQKDHESWAISHYCMENGEIREDRMQACEMMAQTFEGKMCALGSEPMAKCEVKLRKALNK